MTRKQTQTPKTPQSRKKRGPAPERLKLSGDWMANVGKALTKGRPAKGWPHPKKKKG